MIGLILTSIGFITLSAILYISAGSINRQGTLIIYGVAISVAVLAYLIWGVTGASRTTGIWCEIEGIFLAGDFMRSHIEKKKLRRTWAIIGWIAALLLIGSLCQFALALFGILSGWLVSSTTLLTVFCILVGAFVLLIAAFAETEEPSDYPRRQKYAWPPDETDILV